MRFPSRILGVPRILAQQAFVVAEMVYGGCPRPAGVFPLGLGGEAIRLLVYFSQHLDELMAIFPRDTIHRQVLCALELAWIFVHYRYPFFLGHGVHAHIEALRQRDLVLNIAFWVSAFTCRTAHHEGPRWNPNEFHPDAIREGLGRVFVIW